MLDEQGREVMPNEWTEREWSEYQLRRLQRTVTWQERHEARKRGFFLGTVYAICGLAALYLVIHVVVALVS